MTASLALTLLFRFSIQHDAELVQVRAHRLAHDDIVLPNAGGEHQGVGAVELDSKDEPIQCRAWCTKTSTASCAFGIALGRL